MRLLLARHGLTDKTGPVLAGWTPGVHLNAFGLAQAERLGERLTDVPLAAIYSSPLERCRETAAPAAKSHKLRVRTDKRLGEVGYGDWTGQPLPKLAKDPLWKQVQHRPSLVTFPNGESILAAQQRIVNAIEDLRHRHDGDVNVLCTSHADMIKLALAHYSGMHLDEYQRIVVAPASLSVLRFGAWGVQVERMNDTGDLADLCPPPPATTTTGKAGAKGKRATGAAQNKSAATEEWGHA